MPDTPQVQRKIYKVFVSSTYLDNEKRRRIVADAIQRADMLWHGMELLTAETRPTVEACEQYARDADAFVGIIARRYGWVPDGREVSITEIEYNAAQERLMFVIDRSVPALETDYDDGEDRWDKQKKLDAFKARIAKDQMPTPFTDENLGVKVLQALNQWRDRQEPRLPEERHEGSSSEAVHGAPTRARRRGAPSAGGRRAAPSLEAEIQTYRAKAEAYHATLPMAGFKTRLRVPIDVEEIYVPLRAMVDLRGTGEAAFADATDAEKYLRGCGETREISLPDAYMESERRKRRGVVILGDPGSGKTTHLKRLLLWCLREPPEEHGLPAGILPVFLPLRDLRDLTKGLDAFIEQELQGPHLESSPGFGRRLLGHGRLLFLLDGLDEVPDLARRAEVARWIESALENHPQSRFVVTCRFAGYSSEVRLGAQFLEMHLRPLTTEQAEEFIRRWYRIVETGLAEDPSQGGAIAEPRAAELIARLREPDFRARRVFELTRNPLLLTNLCLVHRDRGSLPRNRARLYEECIDVLLELWRSGKNLSPRVTAQTGRRVLQPAALWLHQKEERTRASAAELAPVIDPSLKAVDWSGGSATDFLRTVRDSSGLLTGWGQDTFGFMHLGFQEYLAAREIRRRHFEQKESGALRELAQRFGESWWQEVSLLLLALEDPSLFDPFMREVADTPAFAQFPELVDACLDDAAEKSAGPFAELLARPGGKDEGLWERQLVALRALERLDAAAVKGLAEHLRKHPSAAIRARFEAKVVEAAQEAAREVIRAARGGYELVRIPGGVFLMGSPADEEGRWSDEGPVHKVRIPDFYIGRYPVTNEQYGLFLKEGPQVSEPRYWGDRKLNQPQQPVVGVSWKDAQRYAEWAELRFPSEAEWEYACRAGTKSHYYSGDREEDLVRVGWYGGNSGGKLHPVGEKEPSAFGLYDTHGNVWEWVEDYWHRSYEGAPVDGRPWVEKPQGSFRVIRGGGWRSGARDCRSAFRDRIPPFNRDGRLGFRLSRSSP